MEALLSNLGVGFQAVLTFDTYTVWGMQASLPMNLFYCFLGALIGTLVGVLPGLGPVATMAMLLPITYVLPPLGGLIMLAGIYYGAQYGGSTTAILVNLPGETSAVITCLDGYQMARRGRAGVALATAALGSLFAGCVATLLLAAFAAPLASIAFEFGPAEYFSLMILGLVGAVALASGSVVKALGMICLGIIGGLVGTDVNTGMPRFTLGILDLMDGIGFAAVALGVFGIAEIISNLEKPDSRQVLIDKVAGMWPSREDFKRATAPVIRGTALGSLLGILPGGGATLSSFGSYALEKKISKNAAEFGKGAIEGVAAPEAANNAAAQTSFIPLLILGIPPNAVMAMLVGAMTIHNIQPGPQVMTSNPSLFWGLIASMWVGNLMLVILNLPLIGLWVKLLTVPYRILYPAILTFCCVGVYSISNNTFDVLLAAGFGLLGYLFKKLEFEPAPLLLGFVLGPMLEENLRRALIITNGDFSVFVTRPLSLILMSVSMIIVLAMGLPSIKKTRRVAFQEE